MTSIAQTDFKNILIIKPSSPGDIIHALPVLRGLRQRYPDAAISWLVATHFADLLTADPDLHEVIPFDRKRFGKMWYSPSALREFIQFNAALRKRQFDLVVDLQGLFRSGFLARVTGADVRIGLPNSREFARAFHTHVTERPGDSEHAADFNWAVARMLGFERVQRDFAIRVNDQDRAAAEALLHPITGSASRSYAVLVPATRWATKCWPAARYGELARILLDRFNLPSVLVGGNDDIALGEIAVENSQGAAHNLCGKTTLRQLAVVIEKAAIVVTGDSTPMHMAAAFDRPLVAIFGPTNAARTGPFRRSDAVVRLDLDCAPCYLRHLHQCRFEHACMERMDVQRVAEAVALQLERTQGGARRVNLSILPSQSAG